MPACLAPKQTSYTGKIASVYGWGRTIDLPSGDCVDPDKKSKNSHVLRMTEVTIISNRQCENSKGKILECTEDNQIAVVNVTYEDRLTDAMFCAISPGRDTCQGDSGGPLTVEENGKHTLVGVVSWADGCAKVKYFRQV